MNPLMWVTEPISRLERKFIHTYSTCVCICYGTDPKHFFLGGPRTTCGALAIMNLRLFLFVHPDDTNCILHSISLIDSLQ